MDRYLDQRPLMGHREDAALEADREVLGRQLMVCERFGRRADAGVGVQTREVRATIGEGGELVIACGASAQFVGDCVRKWAISAIWMPKPAN